MAVITVANTDRNDTSRRARRYLAAALVAGALAVTGCGASGPNEHNAQHAKVSLRFQMQGTASGGTPTTLTCEPTGGTGSGATSACSALLKAKKNPFAPVPPGSNCPMLLRSNRKILVTGSWFGIKVHRVVIDGGCDTALFDSLNKAIH